MSTYSFTDVSCSRRSLMKGVALAAAATAGGAVLAACGSQEEAATADAAEIPVGGATIVGSWIVSQPTEGEFLAYSTECTHARGRIDSIDELDGHTVAVCPKHGSKFDVATGEPLEGPARDPLHAAGSVEESGGTVTVNG